MVLKEFEMPAVRDGAADFEAVREAFLRDGLVLLRGGHFGLDVFEALTRHFCEGFHQVGTRQALRQHAGDGFTTEVIRSNFILLGHSEGAYLPHMPAPEVCFFMCVTPPAEQGGETTLIDGAKMLEALPPALRKRLEAQGIIYEVLWEAERWQAEFAVNTKAELKTLLGGLPNVRFSFIGDTLNLFFSAPAVTRSRTGHAVFANGMLAHLPEISSLRYRGLPVYVKPSNRVYFGDGEPLSSAVVDALVTAHEHTVYRHAWRANEVLIIDNTLFMHGREMTARPCERVLISRFGRLKVNGNGNGNGNRNGNAGSSVARTPD